MYCQKCGIHNTDDAKQCQICGIDITGEEKQEHIKIFNDLTQYPFRMILHILKDVNPLLVIIVAPIITILYFFKKATGKPFFSQILNSKTPNYHKSTIEQIPRFHNKSFEQASSYLIQQGFEPLIDLEDVSMVQGNLQRILINRTQKIYGIIHINKAKRKVTHVTLFAITSNKTYLSVDNAIYSVSIHYPKNLTIKHFPKQSVEKIHQELLRILDEIQEKPRVLTLRYLLPIGYKVRSFSVEQGLKEGIFHIKGEKTPRATVCYHHPSNVAVRTCSVCNTSLCEACYTAYQEQYYCNNCLPEEARIIVPQQIPIEGKYAGLGVRTLATLIDLIIIAIGVIAVYFGSLYGIQMLTPVLSTVEGTEEVYRALPLILTQLFFITFTVFYLIVPLYKYGGTIGEKLLGLRVVDRHGNIPDTVAAVVRFAYHLFACLFIFPLFGYVFILFRKTKQGLHDQLAGTFVITKHPVKKALLSWCILLVTFSVAGWYAYQRVMPWFPLFGSFFFRDFETEITLEPKWVNQFPDNSTGISGYISRGEQWIVATSTSLQSLNMRTGEILWTAEDLSNVLFQQLSQDTDVPLILLQYQENGKVSLLNVDPESGSIIWKHVLEIAEARVTFDSKSIVVYGNDTVYEYDIDGTLLWESNSLTKRFQDDLVVDYAMLNEGILIGRYSETSQALTYFERHTGRILWEMKKDGYNPGHIVGEGRQILYTDEGKAMLMYLPEQKPLWESPQNIGHVMAHDADPYSGDVALLYLYTTTSVVRAEDGTIIFSYPSDTRFGGVTDDFLILLRNNQESEMLLVEKFTGDVKKSFQEKTWFTVVYLTEDDSHIYLAANTKPTDPKAIEIFSELLIIHKHTFELREILVGKNLHSLQFTIFPQENLVFIPTYQHVGGYMIPEM
jgi:uncharacterized RDD family membrane protein YckC/outer membrane protein assembly factor BamB